MEMNIPSFTAGFQTRFGRDSQSSSTRASHLHRPTTLSESAPVFLCVARICFSRRRQEDGSQVVGSASYRLSRRNPRSTLSGMKALIAEGAPMKFNVAGQDQEKPAIDVYSTLLAYLKNIGETVSSDQTDVRNSPSSAYCLLTYVLRARGIDVHCFNGSQVVDRRCDYGVMVVSDDATDAERAAIVVRLSVFCSFVIRCVVAIPSIIFNFSRAVL